jgi:hypothetical protein
MPLALFVVLFLGLMLSTLRLILYLADHRFRHSGPTDYKTSAPFIVFSIPSLKLNVDHNLQPRSIYYNNHTICSKLLLKPFLASLANGLNPMFPTSLAESPLSQAAIPASVKRSPG